MIIQVEIGMNGSKSTLRYDRIERAEAGALLIQPCFRAWAAVGR